MLDSQQLFEKYFNNALRFLSFRPRSEKEVKDSLAKKRADPLIIEKIINKLKEKNFLNDEEFAKWWIEQRTNFKPRSLRLIKIELKQKGINKEIIENLDFKVETDLESAKKLVQKKINKYRDLSKEEIYQKLGRFLAQKGFSWETIKEAIDSFYKLIK